MIKRTSFPPWAQSQPSPSTVSLQIGLTSTSSPQLESSGVANAMFKVRDSLSHDTKPQGGSAMQSPLGTDGSFTSLRPSPLATSLANNPKIQTAQHAWAKSQQDGSPVQQPPISRPATQPSKLKYPPTKTITPVPVPVPPQHKHNSIPTLPMKRSADQAEEESAKRLQTSSPATVPQETWLLDSKQSSEAFEGRAAEEANSSSPDAEDDLAGLSILQTKSGRPYKKYQDPETGDVLPSHGCLFPDGYKTLQRQPFIWICPVRDCRKIYAELKALGGHFNAVHHSTALNDNLDGSLTVIRRYKRSGKFSPAVITSQKPEAELVLPPKPISPAIADNKSVLQSPDTSALMPTIDDKEVNVELTNYLHTFLDQRQTIPSRADVVWMIKQPKLRDLPDKWLEQHHGGIVEKTHYAIAIAYLVGEEVTGEEACSKALLKSGRLGGICIQLPASMPPACRTAFSKVRTCVGCKYIAWNGRQSNNCEWIPREQDEAPEPERLMALGLSQDLFQDQPVQSVEELVGVGEAESKSRSEIQVVEDTKTIRRRNPARASKPEHILVPTYDESNIPMEEIGISAAAMNGFKDDPTLTGLEMEKWEFAPGRIEDKGESWAFSGPYLTTQQPIQMSSEISFHVMAVRPGGTVHLSVEQDKLRCVSVATGKVKVKKNGQECYIGPHGAFKVMPGESCVIENRFYIEAWVHCTSLDNYTLVD